ncbi:ROK family protein [Sphingomonas sp. AX6]|uniref:ROK family protein n=1 Tax=Sphingomonas sp. AX6 TaxID=2653171 RepID=UPI0012EFA05A|nr:ROK family protein [Sphingomonas sp. AX6]VXC82280.1 Fructokinase [Sphingomonas sp. AX6]
MRRIAGVELGGTKCVALLGSGPDDVIDRLRVPTTTPDETLSVLRAKLDEWAAVPGFDAIGIASFGPVDLDPASPHHGCIVGTTKLGWDFAPVLAALSDGLSVPAQIETDVNGAALAEARWGHAGDGLSIYITIGTGVGVGVVQNGQPIHGRLHGEAGHLKVPRTNGDGFPGTCIYHGDCVEGLISGPALGRRFGCDPATVAPAHPVWDHVAHDLSLLLHNLIISLGPERIAIGGGVMGGKDWLFDRVRARLARSLGGYGAFGGWAETIERRVGPPGLGDMAGPLGAIAVGLGSSGLR